MWKTAGIPADCMVIMCEKDLNKCRRKDLNPQPTDYKSVALPFELLRLMQSKELDVVAFTLLIIRQKE